MAFIRVYVMQYQMVFPGELLIVIAMKYDCNLPTYARVTAGNETKRMPYLETSLELLFNVTTDCEWL